MRRTLSLLALVLGSQALAQARFSAIQVQAGTGEAGFTCVNTGCLIQLGDDTLQDVGGVLTFSGVLKGTGGTASSFATTATAAGTTTLTSSSASVEQFTGTTTQTVQLPAATALTVGQEYTIINRSTGAVTVNDGGGGLVLALPPNTQAVFRCTSKATTAGTWDVGGDIFAANWTYDGPTIRSLSNATQRLHFQGGVSAEQAKTIQFEYTDGGEQGRFSMSAAGTLSSSIKDSVGTSCIGYQQQASGAVLLGGTLGDAGHPVVTASNGFVETRVSQNTSGGTYTAAFDASTGNIFQVVATTNAVVTTMGNPTNSTTGQVFTITYKANSGVTPGTTSWGSLFKLAAWTEPSANTSRSISFWFNGSNYVEIARSAADVPN